MQNFSVKGVIVPPVTPFDERGQLDAAAVKNLVEFLIERGVQGLFPGGTTGEGPLLTGAERRQLAETVVEAAAGRIPVIIHTGAITTAETLELTRHAQAVGAQAAAIVPPYYFHHSDQALIRHFKTIADQTPDFPIYLYNYPAVSNNKISVELASNLVESCPNIVGMKDSGGSLDLLFAVSTLRNGNFNTASGPDGLILAGLALGFDACVSGNANVAPELIVALFQAASEGNLALAKTLQRKVNAVRQLLEDGSDLSLFKGMLAQRGLDVGAVRAPLLQAPEAVIAQRWQALTTLDLDLIPV